MQRVGIVGAGTMGSGIAQSTALAGFDVLLTDVDEHVLQQARRRISDNLATAVGKGKHTSVQADDAIERIHVHSSLQDFASAELIIEAVVENLQIKHETFKRLEGLCTTSTIFASNTSSLSITAIASPLAHPERVVGMHFFNPAHIMKLVEIIRGQHTADTILERCVRFTRALGKTPVVAKDRPGFIVNRIARPFYGEALRLLGEGVASVEDIDRIVKLEGGFKMGPCELMDLIGIDVNYAVTKSMFEQTFGEARYRPHMIQKSMVDAGLLGRKTKRGFYTYPR